MSIRLVDVQAGFGGSAPGKRGVVTAETVVRELERHCISQAAVRITPETSDFDVFRSNDRVYEASSEHPSLMPCPVAVPNCCGDLPAEADQVAEAISRGAFGVVVRPSVDYWEPVPWVCGPLLDALSERRLPVFCLERFVSLTTVGRLAEAYPECVFIVAEVSYRNHRTLMALLKAFPNVLVSIGNPLSAHRLVEFYAERAGASRLLFGTGLPDAEAGAAIAQLMYAEVSDEEKVLIGAGNADTLMEGVRR